MPAGAGHAKWPKSERTQTDGPKCFQPPPSLGRPQTTDREPGRDGYAHEFMIDLTWSYKNIKQEPGHIDIILEPNFKKQYVHFDTLFFADSKLITYDRGSSGWYGDSRYSLDRESAIKYILSDDKKQFRKYAGFSDKPISSEDFDGDTITNGYWYTSKDYRVIRLTTDKSKINIKDDEIQCFYINKVAIINPPYLCPKTGILWEYRNQENTIFSDKFWLFRQIPKHKLVSKAYSFSDGKYLSVERNEEIFTLGNEPHAYDALFFSNLPKTSFLSGKDIILKRLGREYRYGEGIQDNRSFLLKQPAPPKFAITKSAARYLKKRLRISPLRPSEKNFFQMIGALAHIKNETLNRKKVYAA